MRMGVVKVVSGEDGSGEGILVVVSGEGSGSVW